MAWAAITASQTDADSPVDQVLTDLVRTNDADHESRILSLEGSTAYKQFDHFIIDSRAITGASSLVSAELFKTVTNGANSKVTILSSGHICRLETVVVTANGEGAGIRSSLRLTPPQLPRIVTRVKMSSWANFASWGIGMATDRAIGSAITDGVFVEISVGNLRFACRKAAAQTSGPTFAQPAAGTWFEIEIKYIDGDSAECYLDGALKFTFNGPGDNMPDVFSNIMYSEARFTVDSNVARQMDLDRMRSEIQTLADSA